MIPRTRPEQRGAAVILLTVMLTTVLLPMIGLAVDMTIMHMIKARMTSAADAAALAGARSLSSGMDLTSQQAAAEATATQYFQANLPPSFWNTNNLRVTAKAAQTTLRTRTVTIDATVTSPLYFMRVLGRNSQDINVKAQSSRRDVNLVLALDRSSSMSAAMSNMLSSSRTFVSLFAEARDNIGLVVFGGSAIVAFPSPSPSGPASNFKSAKPSVDTLISQTVNGGNTGTAQALWLSYQELVKKNQSGALNLIVMFTDGLPNGIVADYNDPIAANNVLVVGKCTNRLKPDLKYRMLGFFSQVSNFAPTGTTNGIKNITKSTVSNVDETALASPASDGCSYANNSQANAYKDLTQFPPYDYYGNSLTGYKAVDLKKAVSSPQQLGYAAMNAADNAVKRIRADSNLAVVIYTIGYSGGTEAPDQTWMKRISNDPTSADYDSTKPPGLYVMAPTYAQISSAFNRVASEILRLAL